MVNFKTALLFTALLGTAAMGAATIQAATLSGTMASKVETTHAVKLAASDKKEVEGAKSEM